MKKVVSATLAGALAVGMVPAMAFAAEADAELDLLAYTAQENAEAGAVSKYDEAAQADMSGTNQFTFGTAATGEVTALVPTHVKGKYSTDEYKVKEVRYLEVCEKTDPGALDSSLLGYTVNGSKFYWTGSYETDASLLTVGTWAAIACVDTDGDDAGDTWVKAAEQFTIVGASAAGFEVFERNVDATNLSDQKYVFDNDEWVFGANPGDLAVKVGQKVLTQGTDYDVVVYDSANKVAASTKAAGTYKAVLTGKGGYQGTKDVYFTVEALNLNDAVIALTDTVIAKDAAVPTLDTINGVDMSGLVDYSYDKSGSANTGKVVVTVTPKADVALAASLSGTGKATFEIVSKEVAPEMAYNNVEINPTQTLNVIRTNAQPTEFDITKLVVTADGTKLDYSKGEYALEVYKANALDQYVIPASVADLNNASTYGKFQVKAVIKSENLATPYQYGGKSSDILYVNIDNGTIGDASVAFTYKGKLTSGLTSDVVYDGTDKMDLIDIAVTVAGKQITSDYTVVITKENALGDYVEVDGIVDAGNYKIAVKSSKYAFTATNGIDVVVDPAVVEVVWADQKASTTGKQMFYTGKALNPVAGFTTEVDGKDVAIDVPASAYKVTIDQFSLTKGGAAVTPVPTAIVEAGYYTIALADNAADNYTVTPVATQTIAVTKDAHFTDVPSDAWYAEAVYAAYEAGIVNGIEGTNLFAPTKAVKRGDFVCMLWNLAEAIEDGKGSATGETGSITIIGTKSFDDVRENAYYAQPIAWAKQAGVANGFNGNFRPEDSMTREEGIAFIANYADAYGIDVEVLAADVAAELAKYPDGAKVSGWAEECVAWACINDVAGNGATINPKGTITRAEAAAMLVNYKGAFVK